MIPDKKYVVIISDPIEQEKEDEQNNLRVNNQDIYVTENGTYEPEAGFTGIGRAVVNVAGSEPNIVPLNVSPTTGQQVYTAGEEIDGFSPVTVSGVTSDIDSNIIAGNIKNGVTILGVTGNYGGVTPNIDPLSITPTTSQQTITASGGTDGYSPITVGAVTSSIDANISAGNIKNGVTILGVTGNYTGGGITPTGTIQITTNGLVDVTNYANANVQVPSQAPTYYKEYTVSNGELLRTANMISNFANVTKIGQYVLADMYRSYTFPTNANLDWSSITEIKGFGMYNCFMYSRKMLSIDLSGVETVRSNGLESCFQAAKIESLDLSGLITVENSGCKNMCYTASSLTSLDLSSLTTVGNNSFDHAFYQCSALTGAIDLSSLTASKDWTFQYAFYQCTGITSIDMSSLTSVEGGYSFYYFCYGCTSLTSVDFSNLETITSSYDNFAYAFQGCTSLTSFAVPKLTSMTTYTFTYAFRYCTSLTSIDFRSLTDSYRQNFYYAFEGCSLLASVNFNSLAKASGEECFYRAFKDCVSLTSLSFPALTEITGTNAFNQMCHGCTGLTSVSFPVLQKVGNQGLRNVFWNCTSLTTVTFPALSDLQNQYCLRYLFEDCTGLTDVYFPALTSSSFGSTYTNQFYYMLADTTGVKVHFPSNLQSVIGSWADVLAGFNGTNTSVLFDLPATT